MSDGMTDAYRYAERARSIEDTHRLEIDFLKSPTNQWLLILKERWGRANPSRVELLEKAAKGEATDEEWAKLLSDTPDDIYNLRRKMQKLSPFADKLLIMADYGTGFFKNSQGSIEREISEYLNDVKNWKTYDCDKFLVVLDKPNVRDAFWTGCGILHPRQEGPRPHKCVKDNKS